MPIYMIAYAAFRFVSEYWCLETRFAAGLTFYQWSAATIAIAFGFLLTYRIQLWPDSSVNLQDDRVSFFSVSVDDTLEYRLQPG